MIIRLDSSRVLIGTQTHPESIVVYVLSYDGPSPIVGGITELSNRSTGSWSPLQPHRAISATQELSILEYVLRPNSTSIEVIAVSSYRIGREFLRRELRFSVWITVTGGGIVRFNGSSESADFELSNPTFRNTPRLPNLPSEVDLRNMYLESHGTRYDHQSVEARRLQRIAAAETSQRRAAEEASFIFRNRAIAEPALINRVPLRAEPLTSVDESTSGPTVENELIFEDFGPRVSELQRSQTVQQPHTEPVVPEKGTTTSRYQRFIQEEEPCTDK